MIPSFLCHGFIRWSAPFAGFAHKGATVIDEFEFGTFEVYLATVVAPHAILGAFAILITDSSARLRYGICFSSNY